MSESRAPTSPSEAAERVVLTYDEREVPEDLQFWVHDELTGETFRSSFRQRRDTVRAGDRFEEFVSRGCGVPVDVTLRAVTVEGGSRLEGTTEVVVERAD
jgi:hypothetical protein